MRFNFVVNNLVIILLQLYKRFLSPFLGSQCRFTPTCSTYAITAFEKYGFFKAMIFVLVRLLKCHPFHPGGYDPI